MAWNCLRGVQISISQRRGIALVHIHTNRINPGRLTAVPIVMRCYLFLHISSGHGGNKGLGITACRSLADLFNGGFLGRINEFLRAVLCLALCHQHHDRCTGDSCATDGCRSFLLALQQLHSCVNAVLRIFVGGIREAFKKAFLYFTSYHCCCL